MTVQNTVAIPVPIKRLLFHGFCLIPGLLAFFETNFPPNQRVFPQYWLLWGCGVCLGWPCNIHFFNCFWTASCLFFIDLHSPVQAVVRCCAIAYVHDLFQNSSAPTAYRWLVEHCNCCRCLPNVPIVLTSMKAHENEKKTTRTTFAELFFPKGLIFNRKWEFNRELVPTLHPFGFGSLFSLPFPHTRSWHEDANQKSHRAT